MSGSFVITFYLVKTRSSDYRNFCINRFMPREIKLSKGQLKLLEAWVVAADELGLPRSLGKLYGLLYIVEKPLSAKECANLLKISRSSAGEGLRALRDIGAIKVAFRLGERSERFVTEPDLGVLVRAIISGRILPVLRSLSDRIATENSSGDLMSEARVKKLARWVAKVEMLEMAMGLEKS